MRRTGRRSRARRRLLAVVSGLAGALLLTESAACALRGFGGPDPAFAAARATEATRAGAAGAESQRAFQALAMPCHAAGSRSDAQRAGGEAERESCRRHCRLYAEVLPGHASQPATPPGAWLSVPAPVFAILPVRERSLAVAVHLSPSGVPPLARTAVLRL